jgi:hypothetical protein
MILNKKYTYTNTIKNDNLTNNVLKKNFSTYNNAIPEIKTPLKILEDHLYKEILIKNINPNMHVSRFERNWLRYKMGFNEHHSNFKPVLNEIQLSNVEHNLQPIVQKNLVDTNLHTIGSHNSIFNNENYQTARVQLFRESYVESNFTNNNDLQDSFKKNHFLRDMPKHENSPEISNYPNDPCDNFCEENFFGLNYYLDFTLLTAKPYLVAILGITLFFKVFLPMYRLGSLKIIWHNFIIKCNYVVKKSLFLSFKFFNTLQHPYPSDALFKLLKLVKNPFLKYILIILVAFPLTLIFGFIHDYILGGYFGYQD